MITCKICRKEFKQITTSGHLRKHGITREEYLKQFPLAATTSFETAQAHAKAMRKRVRAGDHFVPFRDIEGLAQEVHDKYKEGPVEYHCIRCGKTKKANKYLAVRRKFCSNDCNAQHIRENPELYIERNRAISKSNKGKTKKGGYSRCRGGFRDDLGHYVRSGWEADVCRIFLHHNMPYDYEAYTVRLKDGKDDLYWSIDFVDPTHFLSEGLIEVKGWWDEKSKKKKRLLRKQRPELYNSITFIEFKQMKEFIKKYSSVIDNWESTK